MSSGEGASTAVLSELDAGQTMGNRFLLCSIAFRRTRQLKDGAPPRLPADGHKTTRVAVLEVLADAVSWSRSEEPA